jgi:predicted alpha/beta hydrolase family esterase
MGQQAGRQPEGSLRRALGGGHHVRCPRVPDEDEPSYAKWAASGRQIAEPNDGVVLVGHSIGGTILIQAPKLLPSETGPR